MREKLYDVMWEKVGIVRDAAGLLEAQADLNALDRGLDSYAVPGAERAFNLTWHDWLNLKSLVAVSRAIAAAAAARRDSRGAHFRSDFPECGPLEQSAFTSILDGIVSMKPVASPASRPGRLCCIRWKMRWPEEVHRELAAAGVRIVGYVPDAGHKRLIELCQADKKMRAVVLTTEEEGIGLAAGAWLGGQKSVLLMQSSGVGNVINVLGMVQVCRFPLVMIITMRGEQGEFNPWQVPMGRATRPVLEAMGRWCSTSRRKTRSRRSWTRRSGSPTTARSGRGADLTERDRHQELPGAGGAMKRREVVSFLLAERISWSWQASAPLPGTSPRRAIRRSASRPGARWGRRR